MATNSGRDAVKYFVLVRPSKVAPGGLRVIEGATEAIIQYLRRQAGNHAGEFLTWKYDAVLGEWKIFQDGDGPAYVIIRTV